MLIAEHPLQVLPQTAKWLGLNEAIVLQQLHYWLRDRKSGKVVAGVKWIFNTYEEWLEQFPFWSEHTLQRAFTQLEEYGLVLSARHDRKDWDQRKFYTIDYDAVGGLELAILASSEDANLESSLIGTTETTAENTTEIAPSARELTQEEKDQANAKVSAMLEQGRHNAYANREKIPEPYLAYCDAYVALTGQPLRKSVISDWLQEFSEWHSIGLGVRHVKAAIEAARGRFQIARPGSLTKTAVAIMGEERVAPKSEYNMLNPGPLARKP